MASLYLLPTDLHPGTSPAWAGAALRDTARRLRRFVVEHPKTARAFLKSLEVPLPEIRLDVLDEHSSAADIDRLVKSLESEDAGLLSEAGCPAVADPGSGLVLEAHRRGVRVVPLVGPSSLLMALMASGLDGQRFAFSGYLPQRAAEREQAIRALEQRSRRERQTELFIETPYRNDQMLASLLAACEPSTRLCLATDLMAPGERVVTRTIAEWARTPPGLDRRPTVFLLLAAPGASAHGRGRSHALK
jgi:16S rRNA (cytidine1402-2'-O)-methyltransferase